METKVSINVPTAPEGEKVSSHLVRALPKGVKEYLGPVIVGGNYGADCFEDIDMDDEKGRDDIGPDKDPY